MGAAEIVHVIAADEVRATLSIISRVADEAAAALCAEAVGCFDRMQDNTVGYLKLARTGWQEDRLQALQHQDVTCSP
ncbi:hypothetical protein [Bradyrhizobium sp. LMG 9283]|uniref:hypothetical protein n=1 Tax=Bradyrhizobium sp. LMG 9283 TaxID=592064 RepID=UPI003890D1A4